MPLMKKMPPRKKIRSIDDLKMAAKEFLPEESGESQEEQDKEGAAQMSNSGKYAKKSGGIASNTAPKVAPIPQVSGPTKIGSTGGSSKGIMPGYSAKNVAKPKA